VAVAATMMRPMAICRSPITDRAGRRRVTQSIGYNEPSGLGRATDFLHDLQHAQSVEDHDWLVAADRARH